MIVIGCDSSTQKVAFCSLNGKVATVQGIRLGAPFSTEHPERAYTATTSFLAGLAVTGGRFFLEAPIMGRANIQTALKLGMICGAVLVAAQEWELKPILVPPTAWKKGIGLNGSAGKRQISDWLTANHPRLAGLAAYDQDLIDSCCLALYGRGLGVRANDLLAGTSGLPASGTPVLQSPRLHTRVRRA